MCLPVTQRVPENLGGDSGQKGGFRYKWYIRFLVDAGRMTIWRVHALCSHDDDNDYSNDFIYNDII